MTLAIIITHSEFYNTSEHGKIVGIVLVLDHPILFL